MNWFAVIAAALSSFVLGGLWYGTIFAKPWQRAAGLSDEQVKGGNKAAIFGGSFVLALFAAAMFAYFLGNDEDAVSGLLYGLGGGLGFVATSFGINYLFERKNLALFAINGGYHTLQFTLIGLIVGASH